MPVTVYAEHVSLHLCLTQTLVRLYLLTSAVIHGGIIIYLSRFEIKESTKVISNVRAIYLFVQSLFTFVTFPRLSRLA